MENQFRSVKLSNGRIIFMPVIANEIIYLLEMVDSLREIYIEHWREPIVGLSTDRAFCFCSAKCSVDPNSIFNSLRYNDN